MKVTKITPITIDEIELEEEQKFVREEALNHIEQKQIQSQLAEILKKETNEFNVEKLQQELNLLKEQSLIFKSLATNKIVQKVDRKKLSKIQKYGQQSLEAENLKEEIIKLTSEEINLKIKLEKIYETQKIFQKNKQLDPILNTCLEYEFGEQRKL